MIEINHKSMKLKPEIKQRTINKAQWGFFEKGSKIEKLLMTLKKGGKL